jgi:ferredoxin
MGVGNIMGAAFIEPAICHGCGTCVSECPAKAIQLMHYTDIQTIKKLDALFERQSADASFLPLESIKVLSPSENKKVSE